ncbi:hypothetical protein BDV12DRAFT_174316, partial [Aspergillus spectabilis]
MKTCANFDVPMHPNFHNGKNDDPVLCPILLHNTSIPQKCTRKMCRLSSHNDKNIKRCGGQMAVNEDTLLRIGKLHEGFEEQTNEESQREILEQLAENCLCGKHNSYIPAVVYQWNLDIRFRASNPHITVPRTPRENAPKLKLNFRKYGIKDIDETTDPEENAMIALKTESSG